MKQDNQEIIAHYCKRADGVKIPFNFMSFLKSNNLRKHTIYI